MRLAGVCLALIGWCGCDAGMPPPSHREHRDDERKIAAVPTPPADEQVGPPIAEDLARYTADLQPAGVLAAAIETSEGTLHCTLFAATRPVTVANFVGLATGKKPWIDPDTGFVQRGRPFYDGLTFHRVIPEFMVQGGDPLGKGMGGPGYQFANEIVNDGAMKAGALGMANAGADTNGSQFFVMEVSRDYLVPNFTFFGQCDELAVVKKIARVPRDAADHPTKPVVIEHVRIYRAPR
jgi:cyclophilin family peptidyl-prolyl cis-trans isomerase